MEPKSRPGTKFIAEIPKGAKFKLFKGMCVVIESPDKLPYIIKSDGTKVELKL